MRSRGSLGLAAGVGVPGAGLRAPCRAGVETFQAGVARPAAGKAEALSSCPTRGKELESSLGAIFL